MPRTTMSGQMAKRGRVDDDDDQPAASQRQSKRSRAADATADFSQAASQSTQRSMDQAKKAAEAISSTDKKKMVAAMVRYLLFMDKKKVPVKKAQVIEHVPGLKEQARAFPVIVESAKATLNEVFGFDVIEATVSTQRFMILVNTLPVPGKRSWGNDSEQLSLVVLVLAVIFMKENRLKDEDLTLFLDGVGSERGRKHPHFGDMDKLLTAFVHQRYIERIQDTNHDEKAKRTYIWSWGIRAYLEIKSTQILKTLANIYEQESDDWELEFKGIIEMHEQRRAAFVK